MSDYLYITEELVNVVCSRMGYEIITRGLAKVDNLEEMPNYIEGKHIRLLWSGGLDSTALLECLLVMKASKITLVSSRITNTFEKAGREEVARAFILGKLKEKYPKTEIEYTIVNMEMPLLKTEEYGGLVRSQFPIHLFNMWFLEEGLDFVMTGFIQDDIRMLTTSKGEVISDVSLMHKSFEVSRDLHTQRDTVLLMPLINLTKNRLYDKVTDQLFQDAQWCEHSELIYGTKQKMRELGKRRVPVCGQCAPCMLMAEVTIAKEVLPAMLGMIEDGTAPTISEADLEENISEDIK